MITITDLAIQFGRQVLYKDVNLKFTNGNIYGIIGANGAGKSTLLRAISGELETTKGNIEIGPGERMSVLSQDHFKFDSYKVLDTVFMGYKELWDITKERDALYAKPDFSEEDGMKASELEAEFADLDGWKPFASSITFLSFSGVLYITTLSILLPFLSTIFPYLSIVKVIVSLEIT